MSYYVGLPLLIFVVLLEVSVLPMFRVYGLQPNLMLVLLIAWLVVRGSTEAFILAPIGGILLGLVDGAPTGTALIGLAPLAFLHELRGSQFRESGLIMALGFTVIMSFFYNYVHLVVFTLDGHSGAWLDASLDIIVPTALFNVLVLVPLYGLMTLFGPEQQRNAYGY